MYTKKDFPHGWGLLFLALGFGASTVAWLYYEYLWALGILLATAAVDALLYLWIGSVTVCYRCGAVYRGVKPNQKHKPWDWEIGERFRQEARRRAQLDQQIRPS
jgi:hypothetical protein